MQLLGDALIERVTQPAEIVRSARATFRAPRQIARRGVEALTAVGALARTGLAAPATPLTSHRPAPPLRLGPHGSRRAQGDQGPARGHVNDVVVSVVTGALRRFLEHRGEDVTELSCER